RRVGGGAAGARAVRRMGLGGADGDRGGGRRPADHDGRPRGLPRLRPRRLERPGPRRAARPAAPHPVSCIPLRRAGATLYRGRAIAHSAGRGEVEVSMVEVPAAVYRRDDPPIDPSNDYPDYRGTILRAPKRPLTVIRQSLTELTGPLLGEGRVGEHDHD